jgi:HEAT repeat protein
LPTTRSLFTTVLLILAVPTACIVATNYTEPTPEKAVPFLLKVLEDPSPEQRETAAQALGKIGRKEAVPALIEALGDQEPGVRRQAAWALGMIGEDSEAVRLPLIALLFDLDGRVRETAAWALAQTGDTATGLQILEARLLEPDTPGDTKRLAASALAGMEIRSSTGILIRLLQDRNPMVRRWAAAALGEVGGQQAVVPLASVLAQDPDPEVRLEAAFRLSKIGNRLAYAALRTALKDADENVRRIAESAIKEEAGAPAS